MATDNPIHSISIYPPVGIARIGNSQEYFLASDIPGQAPKPTDGFKDKDGKVKKQVARFRIYAFDSSGKVIKEITAKEAKIEWRVHVANIKSAWYDFNNALDLEGYAIPSAYRNVNVTGNDRNKLVIDPGSKTISGINQGGKPEYMFDGGKFYGKDVPLGQVKTDGEGRLLFFGGDGNSASYDNKPATTFANNVGWHDDTSDGTVRATVTINKKVYEAEPAMVAVTPPDFGPGLYGVVTMYDVVLDLFIREFNYPDPTAGGVNFWRHIYPVLERMANTQWVNHGFFVLFGHNSPSDLNSKALLKVLADPSARAKPERMRIFKWFRNPESKEQKPAEVPPLYGDGFGDYTTIAAVDLPLTPTLYNWFSQWAAGEFNAKPIKTVRPFESLSADEQVEALNRAPFQECLGGPFHPGIELTWPLRNKLMWEKPFRLKTVMEGESTVLDFGGLLSPAIALAADGPLSVSGPGSLTRWLGVPWQTDEASCLSGYDTTTYLPLPSFWAARVPNQVLSEDSYDRMQIRTLNIGQRLKHFDYRQDWLREFGTQYQSKINKMVHLWHELGIITEAGSAADAKGLLPKKVWKETCLQYSGIDASLEQVKYAEKEKVAEKKEIMLSAAKVSVRKRERPNFGRDEM